VALEKLAGIRGQDSKKELISWPESEGEETEVQETRKKGKQGEEGTDGTEEGEREMVRQEKDNEMGGVEEGGSSFSPVTFFVGTRIL